MSVSGPIRVIGKDGLRGTIEAESRSQIGQSDEIVLLLDDGRRVLVPGDSLQEGEDGEFRLPLGLAGLPEYVSTQTVIPVVEEELQVNKREVETGRVRVGKTVYERDEVVDEPLLQEDVDVERVPVNRAVPEPTPAHYEGDTLVVPLYEEVLVVEKRLVLREELRITRRRQEVRDVRHVTLRREEASVDHLDSRQADDKAAS